MDLKVIVLAAGKGQRMASDIPKVLHTLGGIPLLEHVIHTAQELSAQSIHVVYGNGGSTVRNVLSHLPVNWVEQKDQLGTGHAVLQALPFCDDTDRVLILYGDVPLISPQTLKNLLEQSPRQGLGVVVAELENPSGFGRIIRDDKGNIARIIEHKDANTEQLHICEINTGIMTATGRLFKNWLSRVTAENSQKEYYLTDVVERAVSEGFPVGGVRALSSVEIQGINDRWELSQLERNYQHKMAKRFSLAGVKILDFNRVDFRGSDIQIAQDVTLDVNVVLDGKIRIGKHTHIGPNVFLKNTTIGDYAEIEANSVIEDAVIGNRCSVGPFARIRPDSVLEEAAKVGNFVEMKKSKLGKGSKANHLTYLGDAIIGDEVNIGAGTITCNYDGVNKWQTVIEDHAFIGSNTALVAPLKVGKKATIGAGSTITEDVPENQLTLARIPQKTLKGWKRPEKKG